MTSLEIVFLSNFVKEINSVKGFSIFGKKREKDVSRRTTGVS